ncbi:EthD family reductase [Amycolatopsis sp.]|uniref:EthD family reductase n=1 Tax=Amycolatopsis sp. TaxID=37632 RepID=UPI002C35437B|nr:EthD family reductase [Amycolatopsis sp.]HVV13699.1 EthD family reductase [Amycolatopsis sp.]HVW80413.1 EthD family reductase [Mycobacteriales bacterium]
MAVKLVVLYTQPDDAEAFDDHYLREHMTGVAAIPGLQRAESGRFVAAADGGELSWYRIAELWFDDEAALQSALGSEQGQATAADYGAIAPPGSRLFVVAVD